VDIKEQGTICNLSQDLKVVPEKIDSQFFSFQVVSIADVIAE